MDERVESFTSFDVAVIIVSSNSARWLTACLASLHEHVGDVRADIVVVDSGSADDTRAIARTAGARVVRCESRGFAHANNRGIEATSSEWVLLLNPDTEFSMGTLAELISIGRDVPELGVIGVLQTYADGSPQFTIRRFPTPLRALGQAFAVESWPIHPAVLGERVLDQRAYARPGECDWTAGSFMLIRREAIAAVGGLDERFFLYREEPDLCVRIKRAGWKVAHTPAVTIVHHGGNESSDPRLAAQQAFSRRLYAEKHFSIVGRYTSTIAFAVGYALRSVPSVGSDSSRANARASFATILGFRSPPFVLVPLVAKG